MQRLLILALGFGVGDDVADRVPLCASRHHGYHVTLASLFGSIAVDIALCAFSSYTSVFAILPAWFLIRMTCGAIDSTLAIGV